MAKTKLTKEQLLHEGNMAIEMFEERYTWDENHGCQNFYEKNPDARRFYFCGIYDCITALEVWSQTNMDMDVMQQLIDKIRKQTKDGGG